MRVLIILSILVQAQLSSATTTNQLGAAATNTYNRVGDVSIDYPAAQRVRIPVTFKTWSHVATKDAAGRLKKTRMASKPVSQVLRARIEKSNDFYLGDFRIKTTPVRWLKRSHQYQVKLELFKRLNVEGSLEESLGSVTLTGILSRQDDGLFLLHGTARRLFRDRSGEPILELDAGQHAPGGSAAAISRR
jgi:hypothetical protein